MKDEKFFFSFCFLGIEMIFHPIESMKLIKFCIIE